MDPRRTIEAGRMTGERWRHARTGQSGTAAAGSRQRGSRSGAKRGAGARAPHPLRMMCGTSGAAACCRCRRTPPTCCCRSCARAGRCSPRVSRSHTPASVGEAVSGRGGLLLRGNHVAGGVVVDACREVPVGRGAAGGNRRWKSQEGETCMRHACGIGPAGRGDAWLDRQAEQALGQVARPVSQCSAQLPRARCLGLKQDRA